MRYNTLGRNHFSSVVFFLCLERLAYQFVKALNRTSCKGDSRMADRVGQQLGNYRLIQLLGQGGFAEVYLGEHIHLKTLAALKVLSACLKPWHVLCWVPMA